MATSRTTDPLQSRLRGHIPVLDGLRGLAVLLVVFNHIGQVLQAPWEHTVDLLLNKFSGSTWFGVDLFFVLSGFLITGILLDSRGGAHYFRNFYVRRALRIFPLYYGFLALIFVLLPALGTHYVPESTARYQPWFWTYMTNLLWVKLAHIPAETGYLWSLAVEEQFYLFWPVFVLLTSRRQLIVTCVGIIVSLVFVRIALASAGMTWPQLYTLTLTRMDALAAGGLIAALAREPNVGIDRLRRPAAATLAGAAVASLGLMFFKPIIGLALGRSAFAVNWTNVPWDLQIQTLRFTAYLAFFGALLILTVASRPSSWLARIFGGSTLRFFGRYSYAIYMFHVPIYILLAERRIAGEALPRVAGYQFPRAILFFLALTAAATAAALLSWHLWEKHFLKLKDRFTYSEPARVKEVEAIGREREVFSSP